MMMLMSLATSRPAFMNCVTEQKLQNESGEGRGGKKDIQDIDTRALGCLRCWRGVLCVVVVVVMMTTNMKAQSVLGATVAAAALMLVSVIALAPAPARAGPLLEDAISWNDVAKVREILTNKLEEVDSEDDYGHTALQYAIRLGNLDIAKVLVEYGADTKVRH